MKITCSSCIMSAIVCRHTNHISRHAFCSRHNFSKNIVFWLFDLNLYCLSNIQGRNNRSSYKRAPIISWVQPWFLQLGQHSWFLCTSWWLPSTISFFSSLSDRLLTAPQIFSYFRTENSDIVRKSLFLLGIWQLSPGFSCSTHLYSTWCPTEAAP